MVHTHSVENHIQVVDYYYENCICQSPQKVVAGVIDRILSSDPEVQYR